MSSHVSSTSKSFETGHEHQVVDWPALRSAENVHLRGIASRDAKPAGAICQVAFRIIAERHGFPPDFPDAESAVSLISHLIPRRDVEGVIAEQDGRVIGSNFLWTGDGEVAGVGPITVDPAMQNTGIGQLLMRAVLERACRLKIPSVRLVQAAYHSRSLPLYTRLGFDVREPLSVFQGAPLHLRLEGLTVRAAVMEDLDAANALCRRAHGHTRSNELRVAVQHGTAMVVERGGIVTGYTTGIGFFGHAVSETPADLQALIGAAPSFAGPGFLAPTRDAALMRWCLQHGLRVVQPMSLMTYGSYQAPKTAYLPSILY